MDVNNKVVTDIQNARDGSKRLFVVHKNGVIRFTKNGVVAETPFLDISGRVNSSGEQGLLGLAFLGGYTSKKCFYVFYNKLNGNSVISRFRLTENPDVADPNSEEILLTIEKSGENHNGGQISFGPDGNLYIATGDSSYQPDQTSQDLTNLKGKILRINVEQTSPGLPYAIPATNPHASSTVRRREILCWGLRNPWRFSFDPVNGDLLVSDVGDYQREEINIVPAGSLNGGINFGWPIKEGTLNRLAVTPGPGTLRPPTFEYGQEIGGCVIGGLAYRGSNPRLQGFYLFGDLGIGKLMAMDLTTKKTQVIAETSHSMTTFGCDEDGEIYYAYERGIHRIEAPDTLPMPRLYTPSGTYTGGVDATIAAGVPGTTIRYTTDGTLPDETSRIHVPGTSIEFREPGQLQARYFRADLQPSPAAIAIYMLRPNPVETDPHASGNTFINDAVVNLTCTTPGVEIFYTLDQSDPTKESHRYVPGHPIVLASPTVIHARAYKTGWEPSSVTGHNIRMQVSEVELRSAYPDLDEPVDLTSKTLGATFHYTLNEASPTTSSPVWTSPRHLPPGTRLRVLATRGAMTPRSSSFTIRPISSSRVLFQMINNLAANYEDAVSFADGSVYAVADHQIYRISNGSTITLLPTGNDRTILSSITATNGLKTRDDLAAKWGHAILLATHLHLQPHRDRQRQGYGHRGRTRRGHSLCRPKHHRKNPCLRSGISGRRGRCLRLSRRSGRAGEVHGTRWNRPHCIGCHLCYGTFGQQDQENRHRWPSLDRQRCGYRRVDRRTSCQCPI